MDDDAPQQHFCDVDLLCIWLDPPTPLFSVCKWWNKFISLVHKCVCLTNDKNENNNHDDAPQQHFCDVDSLCIWLDPPTPLFSVLKWWNKFISLVHNCVCSMNDKNENNIHQCHSLLHSVLMFDWMTCRPSLNSWKTMAFDVHNVSVF